MNFSYYESPLGTLTLVEENQMLTALHLERLALPKGASGAETPLLSRARRQLWEYFGGRRQGFELPMAPAGTAFQQQVWQAMAAIPYGETATYGQLAAAVGRPKAFRAVGGACHNNPIAIILPCHRVVGSTGKLTGYAGGLAMKQALLTLEQAGTYA